MRYKRSILGIGWSLLHPISMTIVYTIVFSNAPVLGKWSCGLLGAVGVGVIVFGVRTVGRKSLELPTAK